MGIIESVRLMAEAPDMGDGWAEAARLTLERGRFFTFTLRPADFRPRAQRNCFANAQALALAGRARYVEGFAGFPGQAVVHHAWNTTTGEDAIDVTWRVPEGFRGAVVYFGVEIPTREVAAALLRRSAAGDDVRPLLCDDVHATA